MQLKFEIRKEIIRSSDPSYNIVADILVPREIHVFLRNEPTLKIRSVHANIHAQFVLWICVRGNGQLLIDNIAYKLKEKEAIFTFPGQPHMRLPFKSHKVEWLLIRFSLDKIDLLDSFKDRLFHISGRSEDFLRNFVKSYQQVHTGTGNTANNECVYWLGLLINSFRDIEQAKAILPNKESLDSDYIKQACQLMMSPQYEGQPFYHIARKLGLSSGYLRAIFKASLGRTPTQVIRDSRMSRAKHLLSHSNLNITQIAEELGFGSVYSFSRFFHKNSNQSPRQYKKENSKI
jgi:AraC-like DNA-binding protein/mannose-6-phosphate isomerase-like protein (cupin superfamily)